MNQRLENIRARRSTAGFGMLEVLIAMLLGAIGLLGVAGLTTGVVRGNFFGKNLNSATVIAQAHIETIQRTGYTAANSKAGTEQVSMGGGTFTRITTVTNDSPQANMKNVSVTVTWNEGAGGARSVNFSTILAE